MFADMERPLIVALLCGGLLLAVQGRSPAVPRKVPSVPRQVLRVPRKTPVRPAVRPVCPEFQFEQYNPPGSINGKGIHQEMMSRCPEYMLSQIRSFDRATQCHEATHAVDSELSSKASQAYGAVYVGGGRYAVFAETQASIADIAQLVPAHLRDTKAGTYRTYLEKRGERNATFLLDEWTCYSNDAQCTREENLEEDGGLDRAKEFSQYADIFIDLLKRTEPGYKDMARLTAFVAWQKQRVVDLERQRPAGCQLIGKNKS